MLVTLPIIVPLAGLAAVAVSARRPDGARWVAFVGTLATAIATVALVQEVSASSAPVTWSVGEGAMLFSLAADGLSIALVSLTGILGVLAVLASWKTQDRPAAHFALLLGLQAAVAAVFLADDLILFYIAWEAVLIPMFFLIGGWGHEDRRHAAMKFFLYTFLGSALMLVGLLMIVSATGGSIMGPEVAPLRDDSQTLVFWLLAAGLLVKIPVVPLHTWLPDAHVEAPTAGSMMLAGVLLKMGGYGLMRVAIPYAPKAFAEAAPVLAALGVVGILYGAIMALAQSDLKRLVAYSSVAHMGFVVLAISTGTALGFGAALLGMISHGVVAPLLFFLVGSLYERTHTREIARMSGLVKTMPFWGGAFVFAALASLGLPGLSGFPGEFLAVVESFGRWGWWTLVAAVGVVIAAAYNLVAVRAVAHGAPGVEWEEAQDLDLRERLVVAVSGTAIVVLGVVPASVLETAEKSVRVIVEMLGGGA